MIINKKQINKKKKKEGLSEIVSFDLCTYIDDSSLWKNAHLGKKVIFL